MKFAHIPVGDYEIGQVIDVKGLKIEIWGLTATGKNYYGFQAYQPGNLEKYILIQSHQEPIAGIEENGL